MEEALDAPEMADVAAWARARTSLFARKKRLEADEADPKNERDDDNEIDDGAGGEEADHCLESPKDRCPAPTPILSALRCNALIHGSTTIERYPVR